MAKQKRLSYKQARVATEFLQHFPSTADALRAVLGAHISLVEEHNAQGRTADDIKAVDYLLGCIDAFAEVEAKLYD